MHDHVTYMANFALRRTPRIFPADEISHVVHMAHQCRWCRSSPCSVSAVGVLTPKHVLQGNINFTLNGNFARREGKRLKGMLLKFACTQGIQRPCSVCRWVRFTLRGYCSEIGVGIDLIDTMASVSVA